MSGPSGLRRKTSSDMSRSQASLRSTRHNPNLTLAPILEQLQETDNVVVAATLAAEHHHGLAVGNAADCRFNNNFHEAEEGKDLE